MEEVNGVNTEETSVQLRLGKTLKTLRMKQNMTKDTARKRIGVAARTIDRIEKGEVRTSFNNVVLLMNLYSAGIADIAKLFDTPYRDDINSSYDFTENHRIRLDQYTRMQYYCYYIETADSGEDMIDSLKIKTEAEMKEGFLSATAEHRKYKYSVKIVSPPDYEYTFIYFTSYGTLKDKGIIILPFLKDIRTKFSAGVGILLSFSMDTPPTPCFQKVLVISGEYPHNIREKILDEYSTHYLNLNLQDTLRGHYRMKLLGLDLQTREFYDKCTIEKPKQNKS